MYASCWVMTKVAELEGKKSCADSIKSVSSAELEVLDD
jgi:hypothetical protein